MLLSSADGGTLSLTIAGYQFPELAGHGPRDWDANWLRICGQVSAPDGTAWSFDKPCLTTWEAAKLVEWLVEVAGEAGEVTDRPVAPSQIEFTEPYLSLNRVAGATADEVIIRVVLWQLAPSPSGSDGAVEFLHLTTAAALGLTAQHWQEELSVFPQR
jgi:hypothetical protein